MVDNLYFNKIYTIIETLSGEPVRINVQPSALKVLLIFCQMGI